MKIAKIQTTQKFTRLNGKIILYKQENDIQEYETSFQDLNAQFTILSRAVNTNFNY